MTITHDAQEKAFENGQLVGDMRHWSMKWREADKVALPSIAEELRAIHELHNKARAARDYNEATRLFQQAQGKLRSLIERVK